MPDVAKKGITVKVAAELHAEVSEYIRSHGMTMSEFVAVALDNELHPKISEKEGNIMANTRTVAFQVPEEMFQRIKDYLHRNNMTQKQFLLGARTPVLSAKTSRTKMNPTTAKKTLWTILRAIPTRTSLRTSPRMNTTRKIPSSTTKNPTMRISMTMKPRTKALK